MTAHLSINIAHLTDDGNVTAGFVIVRGSSGDVYARSTDGPSWRPGNRRTAEIAVEDLKREIDRQLADFLEKTDLTP
jgi:hypothetical protein